MPRSFLARARQTLFNRRIQIPFSGYEPGTLPSAIDELTDEELQALNANVEWNAFVVDRHGRRFGNRASSRKRAEPQALPDKRITLLAEQFQLKGKHVAELGCFEGIHTIGLCGVAGSVSAYDARIENVVKARIRCQLYYCNPRIFKVDLEDSPGESQIECDVMFHCGVLYHLADPVRHLLSLESTVSDGLLLDTHYAEPEEAMEAYEVRGHRYSFKLYAEGGYRNVFAGTQPIARWLTLDTIVELLSQAGFADVQIHEKRAERNGPRVLLIAKR